MKTIKQILNYIVFVPNLPFMIVFSVYIIYKMVQQMGLVKFTQLSAEEITSKQIVDLYPDSLRYVVGILFYTMLFLNIIN